MVTINKNLGIKELVYELNQLNMDKKFEVLNWFTIGAIGINLELVKYPEGYYYNDISKEIKNKNNDCNELYESFRVVTK